MKKNQAYKAKREKIHRMHNFYEYYYADDFLHDIETNKMYISMIGINTDNLEFSQIFSRLIVDSDKFEEYFYDDLSVLNSNWLDLKLRLLEKDEKSDEENYVG